MVPPGETKMSTVVGALIGGSLLAGGVLCWLGYESYRRWDEPGSTALGAFAATWGAIPIVSALASLVWEGVGSIAGIVWIVAVVPWFLFALQYTGTRFGTRTTLALVVPAIGLGPWLLAVLSGETVALFEALGILVFVYYSGLAIVGVGLVVRAAQTYDHLSLTQGTCLAAAGVLPVATMNSFGILIDTAGDHLLFSIYTGGLVGVALAIGLALFRYDVFDSTPAAGGIGVGAIARETDDLILIVDDDDQLVTLNETARTRLIDLSDGTDPSDGDDPSSSEIGEFLGFGIDDLQARDTVELRTDRGVRKFDPQVTTLTDQHDRRIGAMVRFHDVTDREIRRQRLEVLNRVVRHNLRNQVSVIKAHTETVSEAVSDDDLASHLDTTAESADSLVALGRKAKAIEELLSEGAESTTEIDLGEFLEETAADAGREWPSATVAVGSETDAIVEGDREVLRFALDNLVENAIEHSDREQPRVELTAEVDATVDRYPTRIEVADDGPSIPEREVEVIREGEETPLKHGSGVGLWVTNWAVTDLGGDLSFEDREPRGSVVRVRLPWPPEQEAGAVDPPSER
jgi:signal transduction histidine kinase